MYNQLYNGKRNEYNDTSSWWPAKVTHTKCAFHITQCNNFYHLTSFSCLIKPIFIESFWLTERFLPMYVLQDVVLSSMKNGAGIRRTFENLKDIRDSYKSAALPNVSDQTPVELLKISSWCIEHFYLIRFFK